MNYSSDVCECGCGYKSGSAVLGLRNLKGKVLISFEAIAVHIYSGIFEILSSCNQEILDIILCLFWRFSDPEDPALVVSFSRYIKLHCTLYKTSIPNKIMSSSGGADSQFPIH